MDPVAFLVKFKFFFLIVPIELLMEFKSKTLD